MTPRTILLSLSVCTLVACSDKSDGAGGGDGPGTTGGSDGTDSVDADADGFDASEDCDDDNADIHPAADEICDGIDNDCDGMVDDADDSVDLSTGTTYYGDADGDGYGAPDTTVEACAPPADTADNPDDCDDDAAAVNPGATEICDDADVDEDCSGVADDADAGVDPSTQTRMFVDADTDGFGDETDAGTLYCDPPSGVVTDNTDCNDDAAAINPAATEVCDDADVDEDCSGAADDADGGVDSATQSLGYADADGDGFGDDTDAGTLYCDLPSGVVADNTDCDDGITEVNPAATEVCDDADVDENCSGVADDDDPTVDTATQTVWYSDSDSDAYGDVDDTGTLACDASVGTVADHTDCDDGNALIHPGAAEVCDGDDNDCDAATTEDGMVSFEDASGTVSDVTATFAAGTLATPAAVTASASGTYWFCDGTHYTNIVATVDVAFAAVGTAVVLDGAATDSVLYVGTDGLSVWVDDLTLQNGAGATATSTVDGALSGGNIACEAVSDLYLTGVTVSGGFAVDGAGVYVEDCTVDITDSTITANTTDTEGAGGALFVDGGTVTVTESSLDNNEAVYGGGFMVYDTGTLDLVNAWVSDNSADAYAGGGYLYPATSGTPATVSCEGDSAGTFGFTTNTGGNAALEVYDAGGDWSIEATECDFGTLSTSTNNDPAGMYVDDIEYFYGVGNDATFYCDTTGCGDQATVSLGTDSSDFSGNDRMRGTVYLATGEGTIDDFGLQLDPDASCLVDYYVLSNSTLTTAGWTVEWSSTGNSVGAGGDALYAVSDAGVGVHAGTYYAVSVGWMCSDSGDTVAYANNMNGGDLDFATVEATVQSDYTATLSGTGNSVTNYTATGPWVYDGSITATAL